MSPTPESEPIDHLKKARQWLDNDRYGSVTGANATQVTMHALMSIAVDMRKLVELLNPAEQMRLYESAIMPQAVKMDGVPKAPDEPQ
jgi:hypothetical protein